MPSTTDPAWRLKVAGTTFALPNPNVQLTNWLVHSQGASSLSWNWQGGPFPTRTGDPFLGETVTLEMDTGSGYSLVFSGLCQNMPVGRSFAGWQRSYTADGLATLGDYVPITNSNTNADTFVFNADPDDTINYQAARAGRTVGQILHAVLTDTAFAPQLAAVGIGGYSSYGSGGTAHTAISAGVVISATVDTGGTGYTSAPTVYLSGGGGTGATATATVSGGVITGISITYGGTGYTSAPTVWISILALATVTDLAALTVIPPFAVTISGEHSISGLQSTLKSIEPNAWLYVAPSGQIRVYDLRQFGTSPYPAAITLQMDPDSTGANPDLIDVGGLQWTLETRGQASRVVVRGEDYSEMKLYQTSDGSLLEYFDHDGLSNSQAKTAWKPTDWNGSSLNAGAATATCTLSSGAVGTISLTYGGYGYSSAPTVIFTPAAVGSGATAHATISGGAVTALVLDSGGSGYTSGATVAILGGGGTGATATATVASGVVTALSLTAGGSGYFSAPAVTLTGSGAGSGATATATISGGVVTAITKTASGSGYTTAPAITITAPFGGSGDAGVCVCPDTLHATLFPTSSSKTWPANYWDQSATGKQAIICLHSSTNSGLSLMVTRRIVANGALSAGGSCSVTFDQAIPNVQYDSYVIRGMSNSGAITYRRYKPSDATLAARLRPRASFSSPLTNANGNFAQSTSTPLCEIDWSSTGSAPYYTATMGISVDTVDGWIDVEKPVVMVYGTQANNYSDGVPTNVRMFLPTRTDTLNVQAPADVSGVPQFSGSLYSIEGISRTYTVTVPQWRDPVNGTNMQAYAQSLLDSLKDTIIEATIPFALLDTRWFTPGQAIQLTGGTYTTGYESIKVPVLEVRVEFSMPGRGCKYRTTIRASNRRGAYSEAIYQRPVREPGLFGVTSGVFLALPGKGGS